MPFRAELAWVTETPNAAAAIFDAARKPDTGRSVRRRCLDEVLDVSMGALLSAVL